MSVTRAIIDRSVLEDPRLSWAALGVLVILRTHHDSALDAKNGGLII